MCRPLAARLALALCGLLALVAAAPGAGPAAAQPVAGTIAYVQADTRDAIRLVEPDGTGDRPLWAHGRPDPSGVYQVRSLSWRPDAGELAFASTHELDCSLNESDVFVVAVGGAARRVTQGPGCADLARYPQAVVSVPVRNAGFDTLTGFLYFQGAPGPQAVSLPPGGSATVTFERVADLGDEAQLPVLILPLEGGRELGFSAAVDVRGGSTHTTAPLSLGGAGLPQWGAAWPAWRADGSSLSYVFGLSSVYRIAPRPAPLSMGERQLPEEAVTDFVDLLAWGPAPGRAGQLLYAGNEAFGSEAVYLVPEGGAERGDPLVSYEVYEQIRGLAWLPDGSGFAYSVVETENFEAARANLFLYSFASGRATRLTDFAGEYAGQLSVSPDGRQVVFERAATADDGAPTDLWLVGTDGGGLRLLARNAARPAWSQRAPQALPERALVYLPLLRR